jgi:AcrR family transcriptional regulator
MNTYTRGKNAASGIARVSEDTGGRAVRTARKAKGSGQERRAEILAAAKEMFIRDGFGAVTTRALADAVGLSQTGLYLYFGAKEEILRAICDDTHDAMRAAFDRAAGEATNPQDCLKRLMRAYIDFGLAHPAEYQLTFTIRPEALASRSKDFSAPLEQQDSGARSFLRFRDHLAALSSQRLLGDHDPMLVAQLLWFVGHGAVSLLISRPHFPWLDRRVLIDSLENILIAGFGRASEKKIPGLP